MKILFLNAWQGNISTIKDFILDQSRDTDVFCFQESLTPKSQIFCLDYLTDYQHFFDQKVINEHDRFANSTFVKKSLTVSQVATIGTGNLEVGIGLFTQINLSGQNINICNVHGHARPGDKQDTPSRLQQSKLIIDFMKNISGPKIVGGDFNLDRDINSTRLFEKNGYLSLIKEFNITNTRNEISWQDYSLDQRQHFADHLFVSPDLKIIDFSVPYNEVSDHLPLLLEFET